MNVAILVPRRADGGHRDRLWKFTRDHWSRMHPAWKIVEGHHDDGPFNRSAAINAAARDAGPWDVAFIIDSDVICDDTAARAAVQLAHASDAPVLAYHEKAMLGRKGTAQILDGYEGDWRRLVKAESEYRGFLYDSCSSAVVVSRTLWEQVGGFDEQFVGWGWEDVAFRIACETHADTPMTKIAATCWHLWHPRSPERKKGLDTWEANRARCDLYHQAAQDPVAMRALCGQ